MPVNKLTCPLLIICLLSYFAQAQQDIDIQSQELQSLQQELDARQRDLRANQASADQLTRILRQSELAIAAVAKSLNNTQNELNLNQKEQTTLRQQQSSLEAKIKTQQDQLGKQLRSAYMAGNYDYAKMLFNQEDALKFERVLSYYQYFNEARQGAIAQFREDIQALQQITERLMTAQQELEALLVTQRQQRGELRTRQKDRKQTLAKLNQKIANETEVIAQLKENEERLKQAIAQAQAERDEADIVLNGLKTLKGKLLKPTQGRVQRLFGRQRQGQVRWKGIIIEGNEGSPVKAIHEGRVLYSDWLKGFGLVSIVDHGKGYMSVYGHNQALLKQAGDTIEKGETLALVGQSGGQSYPNLYFELRHKGKALNPSQWLNL